MEIKANQDGRVKETEVIGGFKLIQTEVKVKSPVFEDYPVKVPVFQNVEVKVPVFVDEPIKVPTGLEETINALTLSIAEKILNKVQAGLKEAMDKAIDERIKEIKYPKLVEELKVNYVDVQVDRPVFKNVEVINPIRKDVEVTNAIIIDKPVLNAVIEDIRVTNAIIKDVEVERAVVREKTIEVIHKQCLDSKGNPL